jgi:hypothetical protein
MNILSTHSFGLKNISVLLKKEMKNEMCMPKRSHFIALFCLHVIQEI